ncbi:MAG TPA: hypothetical protein VGR53_04535 [Nitrososphaerales archaeon]|nr:hypothetical protein [Nitrososphaerales archaeon]
MSLHQRVCRRRVADGEYLFQRNSGMKLAIRMSTKVPQKKFQLNETTDRTFKAPARASKGKPIPSIKQCTLPHDRAFKKQPTPAHPTDNTHKLPATVKDMAACW